MTNRVNRPLSRRWPSGFVGCRPVARFAGSWLGWAALSWSAVGLAADELDPLLRRGADLFRHEWVVGDALSVAGDGLGPLYNAASCAACHRQGGQGGAGPNDDNVDLVTRATDDKSTDEAFAELVRGGVADGKSARPEDRLGRLHPALGTGAEAAGSIVLHRYGVDREYALRRLQLLGLRVPRKAAADDLTRLAQQLEHKDARSRPVREYSVAGVTVIRTRRQTPALFGTGLIDRIPAATIQQLAAEQVGNRRGVAGRVAQAQPERPDPYGPTDNVRNAARPLVGKFGWRGQTGTLRQFVLNACANELGLEVPDRHQALDPVHPAERPPGLDLDAAHCEALVQYVASLPPPRRKIPDDATAREAIQAGERLFEQIGCADCHVRRVGEVEGIYSDLLLHDLGADLADPVAANPDSPATEAVRLGLRMAAAALEEVPAAPGKRPLGAGVRDNFERLVQFYSGRPSQVAAWRQLWRTPPLWGLSDSAPYLHDGRAESIDQAIRQHAGESTHAVGKYVGLASGPRRKLLAFLDSL